MPPATLYDFTREELGSNPVLKLPPSSFRYLHVKLSAGISPAQVKGASVYNLQETKAVWTSVGSCSAPSQIARTTVFNCNVAAACSGGSGPLPGGSEASEFPASGSFSDANDHHYGASGEITRVRMNRGGTTVVSEEMDVPIASTVPDQLKITVDNGDNPPLAISGVQLLSVERRVYFDPQGNSCAQALLWRRQTLSPVYDYARFFKADAAAVRAELGPGAHNPAYHRSAG